MNKEEFENMTEKEVKEFLNIKSYLNKNKRFTIDNIDNKHNIIYNENKQYCCYSNKSHIALIAKNYYGFKLIVDLLSKFEEDNYLKVELKYSDVTGNTGYYRQEFLKFGFDFLNKFKSNEFLKVSLNDDYPMAIENKHIKVIVVNSDYAKEEFK